MIGLTNHEFGWMLPKADSPENVRDIFTEILGDMVLVLPVLEVAAYHREQDLSKQTTMMMLGFFSEPAFVPDTLWLQDMCHKKKRN
ncbi:hypothetical protein CesoFtcFv8_025593 [Champsocephalus esox]|uniref:Uncharacterized protein n=1 Tax=Champsocephalus esox TaxID=159716 RepID=A0AAN8B457_9TELE|nr:hypothetical protein CesoFtcFv8_025593 [Champsocephalus esox]